MYLFKQNSKDDSILIDEHENVCMKGCKYSQRSTILLVSLRAASQQFPEFQSKLSLILKPIRLSKQLLYVTNKKIKLKRKDYSHRVKYYKQSLSIYYDLFLRL